MPSPSNTSIDNLFARAPKAVRAQIFTMPRLDDALALVTCRDRSARITRDGGQWVAGREVDGKRVGDYQPLVDWTDVRRTLAWVAGPHAVDANGDVQELSVGTRLENGDPEAGDDYDRGEIKAIDGERFHVAWEGAATVRVMTVAEIDHMVIHEPADTIHWWHEWPVDEEARETETAARAMDEAAWRADRGVSQ